MKKFVENRRPIFFKNNGRRRKFVERELLDAVRLDLLFGVLEVDIRVPDSWGG